MWRGCWEWMSRENMLSPFTFQLCQPFSTILLRVTTEKSREIILGNFLAFTFTQIEKNSKIKTQPRQEEVHTLGM